MDFHKYITLHEDSHRQFGKKYDLNILYPTVISRLVQASEKMAINAEWQWIKQKKPYYSLFPSFAKGLQTLKLDIPCECMQMPLQHVLIRFPKGHETVQWEINRKIHSVQSFLAAEAYDDAGGRGWVVSLEIGEEYDGINPEHKIHPKSFMCFELIPGMSVDAAIDRLGEYEYDEGIAVPIAAFKSCVKIMCGLAVLDETEKHLFTPDVLTADKRKFEETGEQRYIDKAIKRGKFGWKVGENYIVNPSYIKPHFQHYWTGTGRTKKILKLKRGYFIRREEIREIPTGYLEEST